MKMTVDFSVLEKLLSNNRKHIYTKTSQKKLIMIATLIRVIIVIIIILIVIITKIKTNKRSWQK